MGNSKFLMNLHSKFRLNGSPYSEWRLTVTSKEDIAIKDFVEDWNSEKSSFEFYTSGSTGNPKTILHSRRLLVHSAVSTAKALNLETGISADLCLPFSFVAGKMMLIRAMVNGFNLNLRKAGLAHLALLSKPSDFVALTPYQVESLIAQNPNWLFNIGVLIIGGGAVNAALRQKLIKHPGKVFATYGMTETASHVALQNLKLADSNCFKALLGVSFSVDSNNRLIINAPEWNCDGLVTNDVVELIDSTQFVWLGRFDSVINSGGIKIHPEEIETLCQPLFNSNLLAMGLPHNQLGEEVVLLVEGERSINEVDLRSLPKYKRPKQIIYLPNFEYTHTGKIDRKKTASLI
jgi:O-succinylbenzoic acid--CoA ligase